MQFETLSERYSLLQNIKQGGEGKVYEAFDNHLKRKVAIKQFDSAMELNDAAVNMQHKFLPRVIDVIREAETTYTVMDFVEGDTLSELVRQGIFSEHNCIDISLKLCDVLLCMHNNDGGAILHGDLNPNNVLIGKDGNVTLVDYELFMLNEKGKGMPGFAAPEQYGFGILSKMTDIYGLGCLMYFMLSGHAPKETDLGRIIKVSELNKQVSANLEKIIYKCIQPNPEQRYKCVENVVEALHRGEQNVSGVNFVSVYKDYSVGMEMANFLSNYRGFSTLILTAGAISNLVKMLDEGNLISDDCMGCNAIITQQMLDNSISEHGNELTKLKQIRKNLFYFSCGLSGFDNEQNFIKFLDAAGNFDYIVIIFDEYAHSAMKKCIANVCSDVYLSTNLHKISLINAINNFNYLERLCSKQNKLKIIPIDCKNGDIAKALEGFQDKCLENLTMHLSVSEYRKLSNNGKIFNKKINEKNIYEYQVILGL